MGRPFSVLADPRPRVSSRVLRHKLSLCKRSQPREDAVPFTVGSSDVPDELSSFYLVVV